MTIGDGGVLRNACWAKSAGLYAPAANARAGWAATSLRAC